jgi:hypothetical protein
MLRIKGPMKWQSIRIDKMYNHPPKRQIHPQNVNIIFNNNEPNAYQDSSYVRVLKRVHTGKVLTSQANLLTF